MYPYDDDDNTIAVDAAGMRGRSMQDPLYWRERDPQFLSYVQRSFKNVFGEDAAAQDATDRLVTPEPRAPRVAPFRPDVSPGDIELGGSVGEHQPNRWRDVYAVQKGLDNTGHYALDLAQERSGRYSPALRGAIEDFQREHREDVDGLLLPGGPTIERLRERIAAGSPPIQPAFFGDPTEFPTPADDAPPSRDPDHRPSSRPQDGDRDASIIPAQDTKPLSPPERSPRTHRQAEDRSMERLVPYAIIDLPGRSSNAFSSARLLIAEADRRRSIIEDTPSRIAIVEGPKARHAAPLHAVHVLGWAPVAAYKSIIDREATRYGVDPDLVRAIMYVENAQGAHYGYPAEFIDAAKDVLPAYLHGFAAKSILPMNIRYDVWGPLGFSRADFQNPESNIRAGVLLIRRILDRLENPTVSKVATLYNSLSKDQVTDYGARVADVYRSKRWEQLRLGPVR